MLLMRNKYLWLAMAMLCARSSMAQSMFSARPPAVSYRAPDGSFGFKLPSGWVQSEWIHAPATAVFTIPNTADVWLQIRRVGVFANTQPRQLAARSREIRLQKLPHYVEAGHRDVSFGGLPGASVFGTYWYQGNAEYPRAVEEVFLISGHEAFAFHFECFAPMANNFGPLMTQLYESFVPYPANGKNTGNSDDGDLTIFDKVPF